MEARTLWWDEPCGNNGCGNGLCPNLFLGGPVKRGYVSPFRYDHYSTLRFQELLLGLGTLTSNDANATPMLDVLTNPPAVPQVSSPQKARAARL